MIFIGVDPGLSGGICILEEDKIVECRVCPTIKMRGKKEYDLPYMVALIRDSCKGKEPHVFLEAVGARPGQGVTSMFRFGMGYGIWQGIIAALGYPITLVRPQQWKKEMLAGMPTDKNASIIRAKQLKPMYDFKATERCSIEHDGKCEAFLIAEFGRRILHAQ